PRPDLVGQPRVGQPPRPGTDLDPGRVGGLSSEPDGKTRAILPEGVRSLASRGEGEGLALPGGGQALAREPLRAVRDAPVLWLLAPRGAPTAERAAKRDPPRRRTRLCRARNSGETTP